MFRTKVDEDENLNLKGIKSGSRVLDVGCGEGSLYQRMKSHPDNMDIYHYAIDIQKSPNLPSQIDFSHSNLEQAKFPFDDNFFDLIYCSHVIEHLASPIALFLECVRCLKKGGSLIIRAPSEKSILGGNLNLDVKRYFIGNFYDDPTHIGRPWSPQSLYRLGSYCGLNVQHCDYNTHWLSRFTFPLSYLYGLITRNTDIIVTHYWLFKRWESYARYEKKQEQCRFTYYSFKGIRAFEHVNT